ncbi:cell division protein FtsA [Clostridium sp. 19966]|uniref:cell division protein FtsA n=1 Tax=Clostridium sp. 19966 TaxID=2768166 RepID=UPI0028DF6743|nr:cell division protein FtsA [Clostridium sp. 19966]MDT8715209.1 cell division protein FtsA [Clostridium sp. 19966]
MNTKVNPSEAIFSLDIGTRSVIGTVGVLKEKKFHVLYENYVEHEERAMLDGQIHDITLVANAVNKVKRSLEEKLEIKLEKVAIAAAGRFLKTSTEKSEFNIDEDKEVDRNIIRSLELTAVKKAEESINKNTQGKLYCVGYSVKNYYLNGYVINNLLSHKGEEVGVEVIATFLPRSVVDSLYAVMDKVGLKVGSLTLEPIAAMEAVIPQNLRLLNLALIDIGAGTSDIAISSKDSIVAYGMVPIAGDEVTEVLAQNLLVDFNTAEKIKRQISLTGSLKYMDIMGLENEITKEEVYKIIQPVVAKLSDEVSSKLIELNGGKSPNAVFLVGGGAHTPMLIDMLSEKLNLPTQRIGIRGREAVVDVADSDVNLGSTGVTVLGIALTYIKQIGHDFIDVNLNGSVVSLFNYNKHTVMDVLVQAGVNAKVLLARNGKNIRFNFNGAKRLAFGTMAEPAEIKVNGEMASVDTSVKEGDKIEIKYAKDGKDAEPKVMDYALTYDSLSFYFNGEICNIEPMAIVNGKKVEFTETIKEQDEVQIVVAKTLGDFIKYYVGKVEPDAKFYLGGYPINYDYEIKLEDRINMIVDVNTSSDSSKREEQNKDNIENDRMIKEETKVTKAVKVIVNSDTIELKGKEKYIFVDVFNYINFDMTVLRGKLILKLNGKNASYYDDLKENDEIEIYWQ